METSENSGGKLTLYLCECGPIIKESVDLERIAGVFSNDSRVVEVKSHATLCSDEGRQWLNEELRRNPERRFVIAGCSPWEHGKTFMEVCRQAGVNPYLFAMANIREQCGWVFPDKGIATAKAESMISAIIARCLRQQPLFEKNVACSPDVLVVGAGVSGMSAARLLAESGRKVYLIEKEPCIGGIVTRLSDVFPNLECAPCLLEPLMDEVLHHPGIEVLTYSELESVVGYFGNFTARIRRKARFVDENGCYGCTTCHAACPVEVLNQEFECGLAKRKAVYIPYPGSLPNVSVIDSATCLALQGQECDACVTACPFGNIDLGRTDEIVEKQVGAILLATGFDYDLPPAREESIYSHPAVFTTLAFERMINSSGPTGGQILMRNGQIPRSIALVYCAGHDGTAPESRCSKICCMSMAKYIHKISELLPETRLVRLFWDRSAGGKGYREFEWGTNHLGNLEEIRLPPEERVRLQIDSRNPELVRVVFDNSEKENLAVDMVIVSPPLKGTATMPALAGMLRVKLDGHGFPVSLNRHLTPLNTMVDGVLVAGGAIGPHDITESAAQAGGAAGTIMAKLVEGRKLTIQPITSEVDEELCGGCQLCVRTCPYTAISFNDATKVSEINQLLCRGCGSCAALCPSSAIQAYHFTDEQLISEVESLASGKPELRTEAQRSGTIAIP